MNCLRFLSKQLDGLFWILVGSTSLKLRGVDVTPSDIDIVTDLETISRIDQRLERFRIRAPRYSEGSGFRSTHAIYRVNGVKVDVMANIQFKSPYGWMSPRPYHVHHVESAGIQIPVLSLEDEVDAYQKMGRKEKAEKIIAFSTSSPS